MRTIKFRSAFLVMFFFMLTSLVFVSAASASSDSGNNSVIVYFFRAHRCSYCEKANLYLLQLQEIYPQIEIRDYEIYLDAENRAAYENVLEYLDLPARGMPTIIISDHVWSGFQEAYKTEIEKAIKECVSLGCEDIGRAMALNGSESLGQTPGIQPGDARADPEIGSNVVELPLLGSVNLTSFPLIVSTAIIALVDGFNPCSLWVLSLLLSLTLTMRSRGKTMLVGLLFILVSALAYALFISGIYSILSFINYISIIQIAISLIAFLAGIINIKDYFSFKKGPTLSIPDAKKQTIFQNIRAILLNQDSIPNMVIGTVILSAGVSLVELSCTAGFPVMWLNILSFHNIGRSGYLLLLALYMAIYMVDEIGIFLSVFFTMRSRRLDERQGRFLKLLSGVIMVALAGVMLIAPELMNHLGSAVAIFLSALLITFLIENMA